MSWWPRWLQRSQTWVLLTIYLLVATYRLSYGLTAIQPPGFLRVEKVVELWLPITIFEGTLAVTAVLLLKWRPRRIVKLTSSPFGRKLLILAKVASALWLFCDLALNILLSNFDSLDKSIPSDADYFCVTRLTEVLLLLGSLQAREDCDLFGRWIDPILRICFISDLVFPLDFISVILSMPTSSRPITVGISFFTLAVLFMTGNLQIPAAVAEVLLSSVRLHILIAHHDYHPLPKDSSENLVPAIEVFYVLALCQGSLYIMASILGIFSFFPRRSLVSQSRSWKAIYLYYHRSYAMCMDTGLLASRKKMSLASFAMESLCSKSSRETNQIGLLLLDNLLSQETDSSEELKTRIISSKNALSILIGMLGRSRVRDRDIRLLAARVTTQLADHIKIVRIPSTVKLVSSLLDARNQNQSARQHASHLNRQDVTVDIPTSVDSPLYEDSVIMANQPPSEEEPSAHTTSGTRGCSWVRQWMKERWSIPEEPLQTCQDSIPVLGMVILEKLAGDLDNCAEMLKASDLIPKVVGLISYTAHEESSSCDQQNAMICSSLNLARRLASSSGKIGASVRQKLWESPFLLDNLAGVVEDNRSSPEVWTPAMNIIAKLALDEDARNDIGSNQMIIGKLLHAFLGRDGPQDLQMAAGEALVNLSMESAANCSAIMEELRYELVKGLKDMLCEAEYKIYISVAASLLQNLCAQSDKLNHPYASEHEHLTSALPAVMENIVSSEGKELEILIGLTSQICRILKFSKTKPQTVEASGCVKKLVDTLKSNRKPSPEYPRMRRVIIEMVIYFTTLYPDYRTMFRDEGMMEALSKAAMTPSKVEKYRVFSGDEGVVAEKGKPLRDLADRAEGLIGAAIQSPALN